jgi:hypothetical protein
MRGTLCVLDLGVLRRNNPPVVLVSQSGFGDSTSALFNGVAFLVIDYPCIPSLKWASLLDFKTPNKAVEVNGRDGVCRSFHVIREFDRVATWRFPPVPHLLRSAQEIRGVREGMFRMRR